MKATLEKTEEHGRTVSLTFTVERHDLNVSSEVMNYPILDLTIKKWRSPRSRDALNYSWQIITEIADALQLSKDEVYKSLVNDYGELERDEHGQLVKIVMKASVDPMDIDLYLHRTEHTTEIAGTLYRLYWVVKPPHTYNTKEFAKFIDHIIREAKEIGVEVNNPN